MKAVIQRCSSAQVEVEGEIVGSIGKGLVVFLGIAQSDDDNCAMRLVQKIVALRVFDHEDGKFHYSLRDVKGDALIIPNFTLYGDARKGTRPNFSQAASSEKANQLYECFATLLMAEKIEVQTGVFAASMQIKVVNDGPVTLILKVEPLTP